MMKYDETKTIGLFQGLGLVETNLGSDLLHLSRAQQWGDWTAGRKHVMLLLLYVSADCSFQSKIRWQSLKQKAVLPQKLLLMGVGPVLDIHTFQLIVNNHLLRNMENKMVKTNHVPKAQNNNPEKRWCQFSNAHLLIPQFHHHKVLTLTQKNQ